MSPNVLEAGAVAVQEPLNREEIGSLVEQWYPALLLIALRWVQGRIAARVDRDDVVQSALRTFYRRLDAGRIREPYLSDPCRLRWLLIRLTTNKAINTLRRCLCGMRDVRLEQAADLSVPDPGIPTEARVEFAEQFARLLRRLDEEIAARGHTADHRVVLEMHLAGYSNHEIAEHLGRSDATVSRRLERIEEIVRELFKGP